MILSCQNITKSFADTTILSDISFQINEGEKVALIGINGCGKSTLLKIIQQELSPTSGQVILKKDISVGYLAQNPSHNSNKTIYEEVLSVKQDIIDAEAQIRDYEIMMKNASPEELDNLYKQYNNALHSFESRNGYAYKSEITGVLNGLGFTQEDYDRPINSLSGGQKTRVALGKILLENPDLLILDEPTNHLDIDSITWLEGFLSSYKGAVLIVAHDRYFLDKIVTKVIGIENTKINVYQGNYSEFAKKLAHIRESKLREYLNQQQEIKHQEAVIEKLRSFNREKSIKRAESREKLLSKMTLVDKPVNINDKMKISFSTQVESGNDVLSVKGLSKTFGNNTLFSDLSFDIKKKERVAIIGGNGTGKTTILKIINQLLDANEGEITYGSNVSIAYYDQEHQVLNEDNTLFEEISDAYPSMDNTHIRNVLASFLFTNDDVFKKISSLSGGEKGRLSLAKLMLSNANLLILDEPTNHLDITSKEILEEALVNYEGTVLYVSHDRYFVNKTATRILSLTGKKIISYPGNYDFYIENKAHYEDVYLHGKGFTKVSGTTSSLTASTDNSKKSDGLLDWEAAKQQKAILRKRQNEIKKIEDEIDSLETRNMELDELMAQPQTAANLEKLLPLSKEKEANEERLLLLMEQWETLNE